MMAPGDIGLIVQAAAITLVFVQGTLFHGLRTRGPKLWRELAVCSLCVGFWVGLGWTLLERWGGAWVPLFHGAFANGAVTGVLALSVRRVWDKLDSQAAAYDRYQKKGFDGP